MNELTFLPSTVVDELEKAEIPRDSVIFCHNNRWIYRTFKKPTDNEQLPFKSIDSLGPFALHPVDVTFILYPENSQYTIVNIEGVKLSDECKATGVFGPIAQITLEGSVRRNADIPDEATHFCWLYQPNNLTIDDDKIRDNTHAMNLLKIGGFAYFVGSGNNFETLRLVRVNSLILSADGGLTFEGPNRWLSEFTEELWNAKRFQPVTLPNLREKGAKYFAFINPCESFVSETDPSPWIPAPHGAFVYLFNDDHSPHPLDCYFTVVDDLIGVSVSND